MYLFSFFFNDTLTTEIYTLSLHDALPISTSEFRNFGKAANVEPRNLRKSLGSLICQLPTSVARSRRPKTESTRSSVDSRSEEHTSELQSLRHLVCRLLLEKKKKNKI